MEEKAARCPLTLRSQRKYFFLPFLLELEPHNTDQENTKSSNEGEQNQDVSVVTVEVKSKELEGENEQSCGRHCSKSHTISKITTAGILSGTPCISSIIISPDPTSFTDSASRVYYVVERLD